MTKPLKEELQVWLEKFKQDEQNASEKYSTCGQLFRLPDGLPIAPELLTKWYRLWRAEHPEFEQIVFHGLRHSSATYQLLQSDGDFKSVQGNTGHATAFVLMDTYAHTQDKPRLELTEKIEANFYSQDLTPAAPQPRQNEKPAATKISGKEILEANRLMDADERRKCAAAFLHRKRAPNLTIQRSFVSAPPGTRTLGPLIKRASRRFVSIYGNSDSSSFSIKTALLFALKFLHPLSDFATKSTLCTF